MRTEVVVVGGGSSGAVVAARLVEAGVDVVLVEAGPDYGPFAKSETRWPSDLLNAHTIPLSHDWGYGSGPVDRRQPWTFERARVIGGCSSHNGAIAAVGHASDYDAWGIPEWRTEVLRPLFTEALRKMRVRAYEDAEAGPFHARCLDAARSLGWTIASDLCDLDANEAFGLETVNIVDGIRWNTAFAYLDPVREKNLRIVDRCEVDRFIEHTNGVQLFGRRSGEDVRIDADALVLSAGVYGTPAIVQRSGVGDPTRLREAGIDCTHQLIGVGANLHDHPMIHADRRIGADLQAWLDEAAIRGQLPEEQTLGKACSSIARRTDNIFDLHIFPVCASTQTALTGGNALVEVACVTPRSRGRVDVVSASPSDAPRIDHRYLTDPDDHDITVLRDGLELAQALLNEPSLASVLGEAVTDTSTDDAIRREVLHYYHPVGTCSMGDRDDSVCDGQGRVHGLQHVRIADCSLMPQIPRANTNVPAVVIGERVAQLLLAAR